MDTPTARFVFDRKHVATRSNTKDRKKGLVQIVVMHRRKRKYIGTGIKVFLEQWRTNSERHIINSIYADEYNDILSAQMSSVLKQIAEQIENDSIDITAIGNIQAAESMSVSECAERMSSEHVFTSKSTEKTYKSFRDTFASYQKFNNIRSVTSSDVAEYDKALDDSGNSSKTRRIKLNYLRLVFEYAVERGIIKENPMERYKLPKVRSKEIIYLTDEEIAQIAQAVLPERLLIARDLFLFQCYTGMSWIDMATLDRSMVQTQQAATYINRSRTKTQVHYRTKLLTPAREILERHGGELPMTIGYDAYRKQLHDIGKEIGLKKKINSHVGRHTFATWALSHGTPIEIVSKMLGHTNIQTTQIYAKILAKDVEAQFDELEKVFDEKQKTPPSITDSGADNSL